MGFLSKWLGKGHFKSEWWEKFLGNNGDDYNVVSFKNPYYNGSKGNNTGTKDVTIETVADEATSPEVDITITFQQSNAGYKNTLGHYTIGDDGTIEAAAIDFENVRGIRSGTESSFSVAGEEANIGVFIIANGYNRNGKFRKFDLDEGELNFVYNHGQADARPANIADDGQNISLVYTNGDEVIVLKGYVYHSLLDGNEVNNLNIDGIDHAMTDIDVDGLTSTTKVSFEDLKGGGDNDFNDVIFEVTVTKPEPVNTDPVANDDDFAGVENQDVVGNLLADNGNGVDTDADGDALTVIAATVTTVHGGTVVILENGDFTYTPANGFLGSDSFDYTLSDGNGGLAVGTASIEITTNDIIGTSGDDILNGTEYDDDIFALSGDDVVFAGAGNDFVLGGNDSDVVEAGDGDDNVAGGGGDDILRLQWGNDTGFGGDGEDVLYGNGGDDDLSGGNDDDRLYGHSDNDTLNGDAGNDLLFGGSGIDTLNGGADNDDLYGGSGNDTLNGDDGNDNLYGEDGNDVLNGGFGNDRLYGDLINGTEANTGNDILNGDDGDDKLYGNSGRDLLNGGADNDELYGGDDNDVLNGGSGNDILNGEAGNDVINGGDGADIMYGGGGRDIFEFTTIDGVQDGIRDFTISGADRDIIDISDVLIGYDQATSDVDDFIFVNYFHGNRTEIFINQDGQGNDWVNFVKVQGADFAGLSNQDLVDNGVINVDSTIL